MNIRATIKKYLPSYRTEKRIAEKINELKQDLREADKKNEYLFWLSQMKPGESMEDTKKRLFLQMPKAEGRLRDIQKAENYILQRVKDICDTHGLEMFLIGGTLLGAVRHHGFIPWDNDIDIGMIETDFLKLKRIMEDDSELRFEYFYNYEVGLKVPKIKFRNNDVFWIDVFVFDFIDASSESAGTIWEETKRLNSQYSAAIKEIAKPYLDQYPGKPVSNHVMDKAVEAVEREYRKEFGKFGHGEYFCGAFYSPYWCRDPRGIFPAKDRLPLLKNAVEFEGRKYDVWADYEQALAYFYGNYWSLPFSISEPHTTELDQGLEEAIAILKGKGILD